MTTGERAPSTMIVILTQSIQYGEHIGSSGGDENVSAMPNAQPRAPCLAHKIRIFLGGRLEILRRRAAAAYDINRIKQSINQASNLLLPIIAIQHTYTRSIAALSFSHNTISYHHG